MQIPLAASQLKQRFQHLDWSLIKGSAVLSAGSIAARGLAMVFWLLLARAFTPDGYGAIQYDITLGMLVASLTHPFGQYVIARYVGRHVGDAEQLRTTTSNLVVFSVGLCILTLLVAVPVLLLFGKFNISIVVVFVGVTLFYSYWGLASGSGASGRLTLAYFASNLMQLGLVALALFVLGLVSGQLMTAIYGAAYFVPLLLIQLAAPVPISVKPSRIQPGLLKELAQFSWPVWLSHIGYTVASSAPVLLLEHFSGTAAVGVFALGSTLTAVFSIINTSVATTLLPKMAALSAERRRQVFRQTLLALLALNTVFMIAYIGLIDVVIERLFGDAYLGAKTAYIVLGLGQMVHGITVLVTAVLVGGGRVRLEALGRIASPVVCLGAGFVLVPLYGILGAAYALAAASAVPLLVYALATRRATNQNEQPMKVARSLRLLSGSSVLTRIREQLQHSSGRFIQQSFLLAVGFAIARVFGLFYSLLLGRVLSAEDFGYVQYSILLAGIIGIGTQPLLQHTLAWLVSVHRHDGPRLSRVVTTTFAMTGLVALLSLALSGVIFAITGAFNPGALLVFLGVTIYYGFYGIARGFEDSMQLSLVFIASNVVQFVALVIVYFVIGSQDTLPALAIYGLSYVGPVLYLTFMMRSPIPLKHTQIQRTTAVEILTFTLPLWGSHALFAFGTAGDVFLLTSMAGEAAAGAFVFNRTLCILFDFLPSAVSTIIMPRIAASSGSTRRLTLLSVGIVLVVSVLIGAVYLALYSWIMGTFFSPDYRLPLLVVLLMIVSSTLFGIHGILTSVAMGKNQPSVELASRVLVLVLLYGGCYLLIPGYGVMGVAITNVAVAAVVVATFPLLTKLIGPNKRHKLAQSTE